MLGSRMLIGVFVIVTLLLGAMAAAAPGHDGDGCLTPFGVAQGKQHDCDGCLRAPPEGAACQAACAGIAAASATAMSVPFPAHEATWLAATEADRTGLASGPDPRPPENRRLT